MNEFLARVVGRQVQRPIDLGDGYEFVLARFHPAPQRPRWSPPQPLEAARQQVEHGVSSTRWMTVRASAQRVPVSDRQLQRWAREGRVDARKVRGRWLLNWESVLRELDSEFDRLP